MIRRYLFYVIVIAVGTQGVIAADGPVAVSPGLADAVAAIESRCPTFNWGETKGASGYELIVYGIGQTGNQAKPVLHERFTGSVTGWTPSLDRCLEPAGQYAWMVRALDRRGAGAWSAPRLFKVSTAPSATELADAVALVRRYLGSEIGSPAADGAADGAPTPSAPDPDTAAAPQPADVGLTQLSVDGGIEATSFTGDGSTLTALDPTEISSGTATIDIDGTATGLSVTLPVASGGTGATDDATARGNLGAAAQADYSGHTADDNAHHTKTVDTNTTCNGIACDGANFTNLPWAALTDVPAGLDDGDDSATYFAGPGLTLTANTFSLATGPALAPVGNQKSTVESAGDTGHNPSITIGVDGLPIIAFQHISDGVKVAKCNDLACSGTDETITLIDAAGTDPSITIGVDGYPLISYKSTTANDLWVAKCNDHACSGGDETLSPVDAGTFDVGAGSTVIIGSDGQPLVCYRDASSNRMKVAKCNDDACAGGDETLSYLDSAGSSSNCTDMTLAPDGLPLIVFNGSPGLWVAKCNDHACTGLDETLSPVDASGSGGSIAVGADGFPVISYAGKNAGLLGVLKAAKCNDIACSGGGETLTIVDDINSSSPVSSIVLNADGLPTIFYSHWANSDLMMVKCNDDACSLSDEALRIVDGQYYPYYVSTTIGADGLPITAYGIATVKDLRAVHCGSEFCVPYFRRR